MLSETAVLEALAFERLASYLCDVPSPTLSAQPCVIALPHQRESTREADEKCAVMVVDQLRDDLEHRGIAKAVNFSPFG